MKIVVIGGAGVFGSRLARMLLRDGHDVVIAGRSATSLTAMAQDIGATPLVLDRAGDLTPLWAQAPDVVIDAAGPFHAYGKDPYALPRHCIARGINYLDLADDAAFCAGISTLDAAAKEAGVFALSGVSSVPALSSAVVAGLAAGGEIDAIHTAILPGNHAPRGRAVVDSILHQAGRDMHHQIDGATTTLRSWSQRRCFDLGQGVRRYGYAIGVPDQTLFPAFFGARTVTFHAGLELAVMNRGLAVLSWMRHHLTFPMPTPLIYHAARLLAPFGTDVGGMSVRVVMSDGTRHDWRLLVRQGEGPFVPGIAGRCLLRDPSTIAPGARPALAEMPLEAVENALSDLAATIETETTQPKPLFARVLGEAFDALPQPVQNSHQTHAPRHLTGHSNVDRGRGILPRLIAAAVRFPKAGTDISLAVIKTPTPTGEHWQRDFGGQVFHSTLRQTPHGMTESIGPMTFTLGLHVAADGLHFPVSRGHFLGIPMPKWLLPRSEAVETAQDGKLRFDVALYAPLTGQLIVRYRGILARANMERV